MNGGAFELDPATLLKVAYAANLVILIPVVTALLWHGTTAVFGPGIAESPALRLLVAALWGAIGLCSLIGLFRPEAMIGILALQVIYKSAWLATYVLPAWTAGAPIPRGPTLFFVPIVVIWPMILIHALA